MATASVTYDDKAFLRGLEEAFVGFRKDATTLVDTAGTMVVDRAQELVAVLDSPTSEAKLGELRDSITSEPGQDENGPFVVVGSRGVRYAVPQEYGTYKMAAHPFMRPALALVAKELKLGGLSASLRSGRARANAHRAALRTKVRKAYQSGQISQQEAHDLSKLISSRLRYRGK